MNQDLRRKRQTEIEAINGAIVRLGKELGIATPVNTTLTNLIKIAETKHRQGGHS
jgi:2-dehydropantoate 2-reductase